uniref:Uncharacterized protein n=1 Tax=Meloidogyne floridensis TaxID=298350 RepID=A0A915P0P4_9BILA
MKVFTVGLDQKPVEENKEKTDSPPPGYSTTETRIPLPMGPELPRPSLPIPPPQPIIVRKSRGYKGILLVMLSVFLMAIFALVLSEMAYSRQRDENYFKLRWAELKQRFGYENDGNIDYYTQAANAISDKLLSLTKSNEIQLPRVPQSASLEEETTSSSTTQDTPVVAIDTFPMAPSKIGNSADSSISRSSQTSDEVEPPHPFFGSGNFNGAFSQIRDARLKFLRNILQKIKQHAEDIVEVEPQNSDSSSTSNEDNNNNNNLLSNGNWPSSIFQRPQQQQQVLQFPQSSSAHFFPHPRPLVEDFKNSRSFLDGFGEMHQPSLFMQNNQVGEQEEQQRPRFFSPWALQQNELPSSHPIMPSGDMQQQQQIPSFIDKFLRWPRINGFRQSAPEMLFFHPFFQPQQQQQQQQMNMRFPPPPPPSSDWAHPQQNSFGFGGNSGALPRPSSFEHWNNGVFQPQQNSMPQQQQQIPPSMGMMGGRQIEQQQLQQQPPQPQQPQVIYFPEAKLSAPSVVIGDSGEEKSQVVQQPGQQPQQPKQPEQKESSWMTPDLLPAWLFDNLSSRKSNAAGGPPSPQQPAEMAPPKFPSVSVIENNPSGSKSESDSKSSIDEGNSRSDETENTPSRLSADALPVETPKVIDIAHGEIGKINNNNKDDKDDDKDDTIGNSHQPEEVIEVDAAPQLNEQQTEQKNDEQKNEQNESKDQKEDQPKEQKEDEKTETKPVNVPLQQQKLFPEMPSVFFQVDDPANDHQAAAIQPAQDNLHLAERA